MSEDLGLVAHAEDRRNNFVNMVPGERVYSEETARRIDAEVSRIVDNCYANAVQILRDNRAAIDRVVELLLEREVMDGDELRAILNGTESAGNGKQPDGDVPSPHAEADVAEPGPKTTGSDITEHDPKAAS